MRLNLSVAAFAALLAAGPVNAQAWIEYRNLPWGFSINFPHEPRSELIEYKTYYETMVPARVFSAERGTGRYTLTVVSFSGDPTDSLTAVSHAAEAIRAKGQPTYYAFANLDGIPGQLVSVTQPDGRIIQAGIYFVDQRLYIAEGSVAAGNPAPSQFQQSISINDPEGNRFILDDIYN